MSLRHRIVLFFLSLLIVSTIATIGSVLLATNNSVKTQAQSKLVVGKNVFEQLLFERGNQLLNAATVLVADFGFKDAITSNDGATIKSALVNNQERINADLMLLITLEGNIISSDQQSKLDKALLKELLILAQTQNGTSGIVMINEDIYQFVMLPVKAPVTLAWTLIATRIDKDFAQQLKALTNLDVVFKAHDKKYKTVIVSTIESLSTKDNLDNTEARLLDTVLNDHNDFLTLPVQLADSDFFNINAYLNTSLAESYLLFYPLKVQIIAIASITLILSIISAFFIARKSLNPLLNWRISPRK